jgi:hypothetical protein
VFITVGNHDWNDDWTSTESINTIYERAHATGTCYGQTGVAMACTYEGITMVLVAPGITGESHAEFAAAAFSKYHSSWRICKKGGRRGGGGVETESGRARERRETDILRERREKHQHALLHPPPFLT